MALRGMAISPFLASFVVATSLATTAGASNLVVNGDFETGALAGYSSSGVDIDSSFPNTGAYDAVFDGPLGGVLSQNLATNVGQAYTLNFALLDASPSLGDAFTVTLGGFSTTIPGFQAAPPGDLPSFYTAESLVIPASDITGSSTLTFQSVGEFNLDDISVSAVPEPASWAMMVVGAGLLGALARRRTRLA